MVALPRTINRVAMPLGGAVAVRVLRPELLLRTLMINRGVSLDFASSYGVSLSIRRLLIACYYLLATWASEGVREAPSPPWRGALVPLFGAW